MGRNGRLLTAACLLLSFAAGAGISVGKALHGQHAGSGHDGHGAGMQHVAAAADSGWTNSPIVVELDNVQGERRNFPSGYGSKRYLVNFWATWCPPCIHELPLLSEFHDSLAEQDLAVIGIAIDGPAKVKEFLAERPIAFESLVAGATGFDILPRKEGVPPYLPASFLVDSDGKIIQQKAGPFADIAEISEFIEGVYRAN